MSDWLESFGVRMGITPDPTDKVKALAEEIVVKAVSQLQAKGDKELELRAFEIALANAEQVEFGPDRSEGIIWKQQRQ